MFSGRKYQVGVGRESTRGTAVNPTFWIPKFEVSIDNKKEYLNDEASFGITVDTVGAKIVREWAEGEITGQVREKSFGLFLLAGLGAVSSAETGDTGVYEHTFSFSNTNVHQSLTLEVKNDLEQLKYPLAVLTSLKISVEASKFVEFAAAFNSKKGASASNTPSYSDAERLFIAKDCTFKTASALAGLDAAAAIKIKSFDISIEKNVEAHDILSSNEPDNFANKFVSIEGNIEAMFENLTDFKAIFEAGTQKAMRLAIVNASQTIGASSNPGLEINLPKVTFQDWSRKSGNGEVVTQTIKFKGHYSLTDAALIEAVLTNLQTSYTS